MSQIAQTTAEKEKQQLYDDVSAALEAGANLAAYAESVAKFGHGTRDAMRNLVHEFERRAERAKAAIRRLEAVKAGEE